MRKYLLIALLITVGCAKHPQEAAIEERSLEYRVPTNVAKVDNAEIPVGIDKEDVIAIISVPTASVVSTPSGTKIEIIEKKITITKNNKKLRESLLRFKTEPSHKIIVFSDDKNIKVVQPEVTPWWYYYIAILIVATVSFYVAKKYIDAILKPFKVLKELFKRIKN